MLGHTKGFIPFLPYKIKVLFQRHFSKNFKTNIPCFKNQTGTYFWQIIMFKPKALFEVQMQISNFNVGNFRQTTIELLYKTFIILFINIYII